MNRKGMILKILPTCAHVGALFLLVTWSGVVNAQTDCRTDCSPRDDRQFLQSILDACPMDSICELPKGVFTIASPLQVRKSMQIRGDPGEFRKKPSKNFTKIKLAEGIDAPAFAIEGDESDINVSIRDLSIIAAGIHVGGQKDPCRGIDAPVDQFKVNLSLLNLSILDSSSDAIFFEGDSLTLQDVKVSGRESELRTVQGVQIANNMEGTGLYVASAMGDVVIIDSEFVGNERWGIFICNMEGTGQIFINEVAASQNGRGGIAVVGKGSPPNFKTVCMQNTGAAFNFRFGILLFDVVKTLIFNVTAGFTFSEPDGRFGDGIAVSSSDDVFFWDVTASLNNRAGFGIFGPSLTENTHVHLLGDIQSLNNGIIAAVEGEAEFDAHDSQTSVFGVCGLTSPVIAPPLNAYCEDAFQQVNCHAEAVGLEPPDSTP